MQLKREISSETLHLLNRIYRTSQDHALRQRAQFLILFNQGFTLPQLAMIFSVTVVTLYNWINAWDSRGFPGLYDRPGRGRKRTFTGEQEAQIKQWVQESPKQMKKVLERIQLTWGIRGSKKTLTRILKRLEMSWHRFRRGTSKHPPEWLYQTKKEELESLKEQHERGEIIVYYMDESGFCLMPSVPYGWQPVGEYLELPSCRSKRLNGLGLLSPDAPLQAYVSEQSIDSEVIIHCIDCFFDQPQEVPVVIVIDQAPIHRSDAMSFKQAEWEERGIRLFELPSYSPHLNLIEHLWRFMKYEWIELTAYCSWSSLVEYVERVIREYGTNYKINFVLVLRTILSDILQVPK